jgi:LacI family transcriptional regulator
MAREHRFARIVDVAREAGVSTATVSRVLNGDRFVSEDLRHSVLETIERLNYVRDSFARALRTGSTHSVAVSVRTLRVLSVAELVGALTEVLEQRGYMVMVTDTLMRRELEETSVGALQARQFDAIVTFNPHSTRPFRALAESGQKVLAIFPPNPVRTYPFEVLPLDGRGCIAEVMRRLFKLQHRHVRFVSLTQDPSENVVSAFRSTYEAAECGLRVTFCSIVAPAGNQMVHGPLPESVAEMVFEDEPTCLLLRPEIAPVILTLLRERGLRIPQDISVVMWGASVWSTLCDPPLDAVELDWSGVGYAAGETLMEMLENREVKQRGPFAYEYVRRGSIGPAPEA